MDAPEKNDPNSPMYLTHAQPRLNKKGWVAWQDTWKLGLEDLYNQEVYVLSEMPDDSFKKKFMLNTTDAENENYFFDAWYGLDGVRARCILDWERLQLIKVSATNNLRIVHKDGDMRDCAAPDWYTGYKG